MNRTPFDRYMIEKYNTQPFPGSRTPSDMALQKVFCPKCLPPLPSVSTFRKPMYKENYEPLYGFRTEFDKQLQQKWCAAECINEGYCGGCSKASIASTFQDVNMNPWSYVNAPY